MAILFDDAVPEYYTNDTGVVSGEPFSISCWFQADAATTLVVGSVADKDVANQQHRLLVTNSGASLVGIASTFDGTLSNATTSNSVAQNTWAHLCGVWASASSRTCYLDADDANKGTNTATRSVVGIDRVAIGVTADSTPANSHSGLLAEFAIWNVALVLSDVQALADNVSPKAVRPGNLVFYVDMVRTDRLVELIGGLTLSATGTPVTAVHPRVIYPAIARIGKVVAAAAFVPYPHPRYALTGGMQPLAGGIG